MGAGTPIGRNMHSTLKTFIWFPLPKLHFINFVFFSLGCGCECESELLREAWVFYFTLRKKKKRKKASELPLGSRLLEPLPLDLKRTPAAAPLSNEQVASDIVGEQRSRGRLQYFCCVYPLPRIQPPNSHLAENISGKGLARWDRAAQSGNEPVWVSKKYKAWKGIKKKEHKT